MKRFIPLLFAAVLFFAFSQKAELTAEEILKKSEENFKGGNTGYSEMTIKTVRPTWDREMKLKSWAKGTDQSMILVMSPAREKGTAFLKKGKQVWHWSPSLERVLKLPPSSMSQSWMGTDLTNDDLVQESSKVKDFIHKKLNDTTISTKSCYQIELIPREEASVVWGKLKLFIDKSNFIQMRSEMYDEDEELVNVMNSGNVKLMANKMMATKFEMIPQDKDGHKTIMIMDSLNTTTTIEDNFFEVSKMKRLK